MFDKYEYFTNYLKDLNQFGITVYRASGLSGMEEVIANVRSLTGYLLIVEDEAEGYLNIESGNYNEAYHSFAVVSVVKQYDSEDRKKVLKNCYEVGLKVLRAILDDSADIDRPGYGFDASRIDYQKIGPLVNNTYGFLFGFKMRTQMWSLGGFEFS